MLKRILFSKFFNPWIIFSLILSILLSLPILSLITNFAVNYINIWDSIVKYNIWTYLYNSLNIIFFQSIFVIFFGVTTAWIVTIYDFPLRKLFDFILLLPICIPSYVVAIVYGDLFDYSGDFQIILRDKLGIFSDNFHLPNIRSLPGVIFIFSITLYPYVYIISRSAFSEISKTYSDVGKTLGLDLKKIFLKIYLPLTAYSILGGVILSILESLNDFGTVQYFGVDTFTTGIYKTWIGLGEINIASQLSIYFLFFIFLIIYFQKRFLSLEKIDIKKNVFYDSNLIKTGNLKNIFLSLFCLVPVLLGFIIPVIVLIIWSFKSWDISLFFITLINAAKTVFLAFVSCFFIIIFSLFISYSSRIKKSQLNIFFKNISSLGYAIPGSIIAIGVIIPFIFLDNFFINFFKNNLNINLNSIFSGSIFVLCFAYAVRFFTISQTNIENAFYRISNNYDNVSSVLGKKPLFTLFNVHIPIMSLSIVLSSILIFIEIVKELSATLILRPFNFNTLTIQVYEFASEDKIIESSIPSLVIVVLCIIGIITIKKFNKLLFLSAK